MFESHFLMTAVVCESHQNLRERVANLKVLEECRFVNRLADNLEDIGPIDILYYDLPTIGSLLSIELCNELVYLHFSGVTPSGMIHLHFDFGIGTQSLRLKDDSSPSIWSTCKNASEAIAAVEQCITNHLHFPIEE